jgi:hypothetical protein
MKSIIQLVMLAALAWACSGSAQPAPQPGAPASAWTRSQLRDSADTYTFTRFTLTGKFVAPVENEPADLPRLTVDCIPPGASHRSKLVAADLLVGTRLKLLYLEPDEIRGTNFFPWISVRSRTDGSGVDRQNWPAGRDLVPSGKPSDKRSAAVPTDELKRMLRAHTVALTVVGEHGSPIQMQFDMPNPTPVEAACGVE